ncbi:MAG: flavin reductase [Anaerolineae bacterium]|nr:MAG: flavin reductase [Anaerolineae bacterium]
MYHEIMAKGEQLRQAMRAWTTGVSVLTTAHEGIRHGMTVNSLASISLDPPRISVSLQKSSRTHGLVLRSGLFGVTILSAEQEAISRRFAGETGDDEDRLAGLDVETLTTGAPFIKGGLAYLDCRVVQTIDSGASTLFIAEVVEARRISDGSPLVYHDREYRRLATQ